MQNQQQKIEDPGFAPSFSCYSSDSITSRAVAKAIRAEEAARFHENGNVEGDDFEFALPLIDEETESRGWTIFKLVNDGKHEDSSSSEADSYCEWMPMADGGSPPHMTKCKKSSSTGSGSKRWIFRYLLRRSNSERKEPVTLLAPKKVQKRNSGEVRKVGGRWNAQTPVHEQFYVRKRAENEFGKRKSYLPYRKDLVGLFANVNGMGKMLPF